MSELCISSLVIQATPDKISTVRKNIKAIPEAELLGEGPFGKLVVLLDTATSREAANKISDIQNQDGVLVANLIFQYDDQIDTQVEDSA